MKKTILILSAILLVGCGSVKKSSTETEINSVTEKNSTTDATKFTQSYTLEPADLSKPITFTNSEGKTETFTNTIVKYINSKETSKEKSNEVNKSDLKHEEDKTERDNKVLLDTAFKYLLYLILIALVAKWLYNSLNPIELIKKLFKNKTPLI